MTIPVIEESLTGIGSFVGRRLEIVAFGISYVGRLDEVNMEHGTLTLSDEHGSLVLELERVDAYFPIP